MRQGICALVSVVDEIKTIEGRHELCDSLRKLHQALLPLLSEHRIESHPVVPPSLRREFDSELKERLYRQAHKACLAHPEHVREELVDLYHLFVETMEQYCISTKELERAA